MSPSLTGGLRPAVRRTAAPLRVPGDPRRAPRLNPGSYVRPVPYWCAKGRSGKVISISGSLRSSLERRNCRVGMGAELAEVSEAPRDGQLEVGRGLIQIELTDGPGPIGNGRLAVADHERPDPTA